MEEIEIWKPIKGYEGLYEVSNFGRVKRLARDFNQKHYSGCNSHYKYQDLILKPSKSNAGYLIVGITKDHKQRKYSIHKLVANAFLDKTGNVINHIDGNKHNNNVSNLEWCSQSYNIKYAYNNKTKAPPNMKKIAQYSLKGELINIFPSISLATRETGFKNISAVCRGVRKQSGGYKWKYIQ